MWINLCAVTIAMAIGFAATAITVLPKTKRATLGKL
jgi:hypothetical protein